MLLTISRHVRFRWRNSQSFVVAKPPCRTQTLSALDHLPAPLLFPFRDHLLVKAQVV